MLQDALGKAEQDFQQRLIRLAHANVRFATTHRALFRLMFVAKQRKDAPAELIEASYRALYAGPATIIHGQMTGAVVAGDPEHLALVVFAAVEGLISFSVDGTFGGVPLERLVEEVIGQIMVGLQPR